MGHTVFVFLGPDPLIQVRIWLHDAGFVFFKDSSRIFLTCGGSDPGTVLDLVPDCILKEKPISDEENLLKVRI